MLKINLPIEGLNFLCLHWCKTASTD